MAKGGSEDAEGPLFKNLEADQEEPDVTEIESLCFSCYKQGITRLMLTKIPFFKEVIIASFTCAECGYETKGMDSAGRIQEKGIRLTLTINKLQDLGRQVVKSDVATFAIPSLDFEQPPVNKKGEINTIEGLIIGVVDGLQMLQPERRAADPETAQKIDEFILKMENLKEVKSPYHLVIDDPSGNSYIENLHAPGVDPQMKVEHYVRTKENDIMLGLRADDDDDDTIETGEENKNSAQPADNLKEEVLTFKTNCPNCNSPCDTNMKLVDIPFFKEVVIMCTVCDRCGIKENEVKGASGIEPKGIKIKLKLTDVTDLSRDVLKSDTCGVEIPEIELKLVEGTLGGRFSTVEGLLTSIYEQLSDSSPFMIGLIGDSSTDQEKNKMTVFLEKLKKIINGEMLDIHLILDDPAGNSYLQNVYAPDPDPEMVIEHYDRTFEQNDILGLNEMKTENYEEDTGQT